MNDTLVHSDFIDAALMNVLPPESFHWVQQADGTSHLLLADDHPTVRHLSEGINEMVSPESYLDPRPDYGTAQLVQMLDGALSPVFREPNASRHKGYRRRVTLVVFLNDPTGGEFQLNAEDGTALFDPVSPVRGRMLMYNVNDFHSVLPCGSRRLTLVMHMISREGPDEPKARVNPEWT